MKAREVKKVALFANTDWYLYNFRLTLAEELRNRGADVLLLSPPGPYVQRLKERGFTWIEAPLKRRSLNLFGGAATTYWLWRLLRTENIDLIHSFTVKCAIYGGIAARLRARSSSIAAVAGLGYIFSSSDLLARTLRPLVRAAMRYAIGGPDARLILQNPDDVSTFLSASIVERDQVRLIRSSGVDCEKFSPRNGRQQGGRLRVLLPARLLWAKGIAEFVEAARLLKADGRDIEMLIAGTPDVGNPDSVSPHLVNDWVHAGLVQWLGHVEDMRTLLGSVHVVALPSTYGEGVPRSLTEGAACGLGLITTDNPGCREVVTDNVNGFLIPPRDARALADAIGKFADDSSLLTRLGAAARKTAVKEFNQAEVLKRTIQVYEELLPDFLGRNPDGDLSTI